MVKMKNSCRRFSCTVKKTESWENQQWQQQLLNGAVCLGDVEPEKCLCPLSRPGKRWQLTYRYCPILRHFRVVPTFGHFFLMEEHPVSHTKSPERQRSFLIILPKSAQGWVKTKNHIFMSFLLQHGPQDCDFCKKLLVIQAISPEDSHCVCSPGIRSPVRRHTRDRND